MQRRSITQRGFTLLELLVVPVVLGLLAGIVAPKYFSQLGRSEAKVARAQIEGLGKALDLYRLEVGHYPSSEQGLQALVAAPAVSSDGPALICKRPFRRTLGAAPISTANPVRMVASTTCSMGKDGQPGGDGENAEITSWQ